MECWFVRSFGKLKFIAVFLAGGVLGAAFGVAATVFAYPFVFPPPPAMETLAEGEGGALVADGTFIHADPSDPIHYGSGGVEVFEDLVFLGEDFAVGPGPKYHVYLVPDAEVTPTTRVEATMFVDLGRLRAFEGGQRYPVPAGVDPADYGSVVIWCEQFDVLISPAALRVRP